MAPRAAARPTARNKAQLGRTGREDTPIAIRTKVPLSSGLDDWIRRQLGDKLGHAATLVERGTVRFEDINGPRGGVDTVCRIKLVISGRPSVQVEERGSDPKAAFSRALPVLVRTFERMREKHGMSAPGSRARGRRSGRSVHSNLPDAGEIIGRRMGRGSVALASALARPEKQRRDAYLDTADPGVSQSDRRAGGAMSARRNTLAKPSRATATLEDSRGKPSRKSTRRSANRGKPSQGKERTAVSRSVTPSARAARAIARRR